MFSTHFLQRALPFILTLIVGVSLGSLFGSSGARYDERAMSAFVKRGDRACRSYRRSPRRSAESGAVITFKPSPRYTEEARRNNFAGELRLRVLLDADGKVSEVEPLNDLPYGLTEEGVRAAKGIEFKPATREGEAVSSWVYVTQSFSQPSSMKTRTTEESAAAAATTRR